MTQARYADVSKSRGCMLSITAHFTQALSYQQDEAVRENKVNTYTSVLSNASKLSCVKTEREREGGERGREGGSVSTQTKHTTDVCASLNICPHTLWKVPAASTESVQGKNLSQFTF